MGYAAHLQVRILIPYTRTNSVEIHNPNFSVPFSNALIASLKGLPALTSKVYLRQQDIEIARSHFNFVGDQ